MKLFEKLSKKKALKKSKQKYFKKRNKPLFMFSTMKFLNINPKLKRGLKIGTLVAIPCSLLAIGTSIGLYEHFNKPSIKEEVIINNNEVTRRVYLLSKDDITIPLSIHLQKFNSTEEEIIEVFNLLKEDSKLANDSFKGVVPSSTRILSLQISNGLLNLNLSEDFLNHKVSTSVLESSLTYTMLQFDGIDRLSLEVEDKYKSNVLTSSIGINVSSYNLSSITNKELITYYYKKKYVGQSYYVPKSIYVDKMDSDNLTFYEGLKYRMPASSTLQKIDLYSYLSSNQNKQDDYTFEINKTGLVDENLVNKDLYNLILLSLDIMQKDKKVSFTLEGEALQVDGIINEDDYQVSSIIYNEIMI